MSDDPVDWHRGLSGEESARRLDRFGPNASVDVETPAWRVLLGKFRPVPEDKYTLVKAFQKSGYTVGMCGDGANDAPALRQAKLGIAVSSATDVAKSAAGLVLSEPGLAGIVGAITEGRIAFQRILTHTLRSIVHKVRQIIYLGVGLLITDHAILTPMLVVISMITGDFLAMSSTTDNVRPSARPNTWKIGSLTIAGVFLGSSISPSASACS